MAALGCSAGGMLALRLLRAGLGLVAAVSPAPLDQDGWEQAGKSFRDLVGETKACRLGAIQWIYSPKPLGNDETDILVVKQNSNSSLTHSRHMILRNIRIVSKQVVESNHIWYLAGEDDPIWKACCLIGRLNTPHRETHMRESAKESTFWKMDP